VFANYEQADGEQVGSYPSRLSITVDLFTNGGAVTDDDTGQIVAYEDTSLEDMIAFADFLSSGYVSDWCRKNDASILIDGDIQGMTGVVNDTTYQYRSRMTVQFYFTQRVIGRTGVAAESSLLYPTGESDPETGEPIYTTKVPEETESQTGDWPKRDEPVIRPEFTVTSSGGGTEELANETTGYFTEAEVKEEKADE
jgi:hypothetical protein